RQRVLKTHSEIDQVSDFHAAFDRLPLKFVRMHHDAGFFLRFDDLIIEFESLRSSRGYSPIAARFKLPLWHWNPHDEPPVDLVLTFHWRLYRAVIEVKIF